MNGNILFSNAALLAQGDGLHWDDGTRVFKVALATAAYVPHASDVYASSIAHELSGTGYVRLALSSRSAVYDSLNARVDNLAASATWAAINAGTAAWAIVYRHVTNDADSLLVCAIDLRTTAHPSGIATSGGPLQIDWGGSEPVGRVFSAFGVMHTPGGSQLVDRAGDAKPASATLQVFGAAVASDGKSLNLGHVLATEFAGVDPTGATDSSAGLIAGQATVTDGSVLVFGPGTYKLSADITLSPSKVMAGFGEHMGGGVVKPDSGKRFTATVVCPDEIQAFDASGGGLFSIKAPHLTQEHFGGSVDASAATNTAALKAAVATSLASPGNVRIKLLDGQYEHQFGAMSFFPGAKRLRLEGEGKERTTLNFAGGGANSRCLAVSNTSNLTLRGFTISGQFGVGLLLVGDGTSHDHLIDDVKITGCTQTNTNGNVALEVENVHRVTYRNLEITGCGIPAQRRLSLTDTSGVARTFPANTLTFTNTTSDASYTNAADVTLGANATEEITLFPTSPGDATADAGEVLAANRIVVTDTSNTARVVPAQSVTFTIATKTYSNAFPFMLAALGSTAVALMPHSGSPAPAVGAVTLNLPAATATNATLNATCTNADAFVDSIGAGIQVNVASAGYTGGHVLENYWLHDCDVTQGAIFFNSYDTRVLKPNIDMGATVAPASNSTADRFAAAVAAAGYGMGNTDGVNSGYGVAFYDKHNLTGVYQAAFNNWVVGGAIRNCGGKGMYFASSGHSGAGACTLDFCGTRQDDGSLPAGGIVAIATGADPDLDFTKFYGLTVHDCTITNSGGHGISVQGNACRLHDNKITVTGDHKLGIELRATCLHSTVHDNVFDQCYWGIGAGNLVANTAVHHNHMHRLTAEGCYFPIASRVIIDHNQINGSTFGAGIFVGVGGASLNCVIDSNEVAGCGGDGGGIVYDGNALVIDNNTHDNVGYGLRQAGGAGARWRGNMSKDNSVADYNIAAGSAPIEIVDNWKTGPAAYP